MRPSALERQARRRLMEVFGWGAPSMHGRAPGRVTLVGEHVDYAGGKVACLAIHLMVAVAVRRSGDGWWRAVSSDRIVARARPSMGGDIGDRMFAAGIAARELGTDLGGVEIGVAADLPEGSGLSSSAALVCATLVAMLRLRREVSPPRDPAPITVSGLIAAAARAERDIAGIPCGDMDQWAIVASRSRQVLIFDARRREARFVHWPWADVVMVAVDSGESHDVGGEGYRSRRAEAEEVLRLLHVGSCQEIGMRWAELPEGSLRRRARHLASEAERVETATRALTTGDVEQLGRVISASHQSLSQDYEVSTPRMNAIAAVAEGTAGCYGARMVGAGFGGSVLALCRSQTADVVRRRMVSAAGPSSRGSWILRHGPGLAVTARDVVR